MTFFMFPGGVPCLMKTELQSQVPPWILRDAFPFAFSWDSDMRILQAGRSIRRFLPNQAGGCLVPDLFELHRPTGKLDAGWLDANQGVLLLLRLKRPGLLLRGHVVAITPHGPWLFIGAPWLSKTEELDELGLTVSDFAIQDPVVDVMYLLQLQRSANKELHQVNLLLNQKAASLSEQRKKARRLAFVAERTRNAVIITGRDGMIEWVNEAFEKMTGWTFAEVAGGKPGTFLQGPHSDPQVVSEMREKVACGQGFHSELINYRKDGTTYWVDIEVEPITADDGSVSGFMALESDITVNRTREILRMMESTVAEVIALQTDYRPAISNLLEGLAKIIKSFMGCWWAYDPDHSWLCLVDVHEYSGRAAVPCPERRSGIRLAKGQELPGQAWAAMASHWKTHLSDGQACGLAIPQSRSGPAPLGCVVIPVSSRDRFFGIMEFFSDFVGPADPGLIENLNGLGTRIGLLLERLEAEHVLRAALDRAETASRAKNDFLAMISHEIRTPMNGVLGMAGLLQETSLLPQQKKMIDSLIQSGQAMVAIIDDILDFSKIEAGLVKLNHAEVDLDLLLDGATELFAQQAEEKGLDLVTIIEPSLPKIISGDFGRLRQILINLIGNAIKFTDKGTVAIRLAGRGGQLECSIEDTGIGISSNQQSKLFMPFSQIDSSASRQFGGTGLGLAICRKLVHQMGGEIGVESGGERTGARFWFRIPVEECTAAREPGLAATPGMMRIWVADSSAARREAIGAALADVANGFVELAGKDQFMSYASDSTCMPDAIFIDREWLSNSWIHGFLKRAEALEMNRTRIVLTGRSREVQAMGGKWQILRMPMNRREIHNSIIPESPQASKPSRRQSETEPLRIKVLTVEDNPVNALVTELQLESFGCSHVHVSDGMQAIEIVKKERFDVILMDCHMPHMDGYEAARRIRDWEARFGQGRPRIQIIAVTANALEDERQRCLDAGMDDYLSKPFQKRQLFKLLRDAQKLAV